MTVFDRDTGSFAFDHGGLRFDATIDPESPILSSFFEGYDRAFVIATEKEPLDGFKECLALNHRGDYARLSARYGPFREVVFIAKDADDERVGGGNFIAFPIAAGGADALTANLNYVYVEPQFRRQGNLQRLLTATSELIAKIFAEHAATATRPIFIEQNDPFRLSLDAYEEDTSVAGLDQFDRLAVWAKLGACIVDFPYVQPPLSADQGPDENLVYAALNAPARLSACLLREHVRRFFAISVLKGKLDPSQQPAARGQLESLADACDRGMAIALLDPSSLPQGDAARALLSARSRPRSLRDYLARS